MDNRFQACESRRLLALLDLEPDAPGWTGSSFIADSDTRSPFESNAPPIDGYQITGRLGEGGMGVVWRAVQLRTHRNVALKLMTSGRFGSQRARQRFEREIELAARLEHPHIARVYDSGSSEGLWYYAMELVEGVHLDRYVADKKLDHRQILALMRDVCLAVHYAHQRGVMHRDIKPSNILVGADGHAHVVDFGLAKAIADEPGDPSLTQEGQFAGTPAFMSPEQASGKHDLIDTRTDVWGLGATLYLLLSGHTPHDPGGPRYEALRRIASDEVRRPRMMNKHLDVEIESLLLKSLARDPDERYGSAAELAEDIDRYLSGDALNASPPSRVYRLRKFARKHRVPIALAAAFAVILVGATLISTWQAIRATRALSLAKAETRRADEQAAMAKAVNDFLNEDVLGQASPYKQLFSNRTPERDLKVRDALDRASAHMQERFDQQPAIAAAIHTTVGEAYLHLGDFAKAEEHLTESLKVRQRVLGSTAPETLRSLYHLSQLRAYQDRWAEATSLLEQALEGQLRLLGNEHRETLTTMRELGSALNALRQFEKAESHLLAAVRGMRTVYGVGHRETIRAAARLGLLYAERGDYAKAEEHYRLLWKQSVDAQGEKHPNTLNILLHIGIMCGEQGHLSEAEPIMLQALEGMRQVLGEHHPDTLTMMQRVAACYHNLGRYDAAEPLLLEALEWNRKIRGEEHRETLATLSCLASLYSRNGERKKAEALLLKVLNSHRRVFGESDSRCADDLFVLAQVCSGDDRFEEAELYYVQSLEVHRAAGHGDEHPQTLKVLDGLGGLYLAAGRLDEAEAQLERVLELRRSVLGEDSSATLSTKRDLASTYLELGRYHEAESLLLDVLGKESESSHSTWTKGALRTLWVLASVYARQGHYEKAEQLHLKSIEGYRELFGEGHVETLRSMGRLGQFYVSTGRFQEAESLLRAALDNLRPLVGERHSTYRAVLSSLGKLYYNSGQFAQAEAPAREALEIARTLPQAGALATSLDNLLMVLMTQSRWEEAEPLARELHELMLTVKNDHNGERFARRISDWGVCLWKLQRYSEAEQPLLIAYQRMSDAGTQKSGNLRTLVSALAEVCSATNRPDEAARWRAELAALQASTQPATQPSKKPSTQPSGSS